MHPLSRQLAVTMASNDGLPRIISGADTVYLATPAGEVWRVLDANQPDGEPCVIPSNDPNVWARVFIGGGANTSVRLYRFSSGERRSYGAEALHHQFLTSSSVPVDEVDTAGLGAQQ